MRNHFYVSRTWLKLRRAVLDQQPLCVDCQGRGILTLATDVDHILPISKGGDPTDPDNLQCLCASCHASKTQVDTGRVAYLKGCDLTGLPSDAAHHWRRGGAGA